MFVLMRVGKRMLLRELTAANISRMSMTELCEFETRVWKLAERTKFPMRAVDVLNAIYREVEFRAMERDWRDHHYSSKLPG